MSFKESETYKKVAAVLNLMVQHGRIDLIKPDLWAASRRKTATCPLCKASFVSITKVDDAAYSDQKIYSQTIPYAPSTSDILILADQESPSFGAQSSRLPVCCECRCREPEDLLWHVRLLKFSHILKLPARPCCSRDSAILRAYKVQYLSRSTHVGAWDLPPPGLPRGHDCKCGTGEDPRLKQFSDWLQCRLVDESNWIGIRSCLTESKICSDPAISGGKPGVFLPIKNGCCMPPSQCGFVLKNGSIWTIPKSGLASNHHDCLMWSSKPNRLCYYCYSCKAGFLARLKNDWRKLTTFSICLVSFLIINFIIGCLACRSSQAVGLFQIRRKDQF
ncbi:hypothetical protein VitviT2T_021965 [Vitis vinifera]|uniref:Uncharacterized protein n=1 Tax=Vitis vinifera TaxID=29760 RepID=A0ABY9DAN4_VITVI|nr:hypothetical protein VitviT2T_021965 [Vitis vinifera]